MCAVFAGFTNLHVLDLHGNLLNELSGNILAPLTSMPRTYTYTSPLSCNAAPSPGAEPLCPDLKVAWVGAHPYHGVERATAAEDLAPRPIEAAALQLPLRLRGKYPVPVAPEDLLMLAKVVHGGLDFLHVVVGASLEKESCGRRESFGEARREGAPRTSTADDDEIHLGRARQG